MNPPNGQAPLDYLNQIAPQAPKKKLFELNMRTLIIGGAALVILVIIISLFVSSLGSAQKEPWQRLAARLETTAAITDDASSKIKSSQLRSLNSDLRLFLTNTSRDVTPILTKLDITTKKLPEKITTQESGTTVLATLEDGRLNAKYDATYVREMSYKLATLLSLLQQLYGSSSSSTKVFLQTAYDDLVPIYKAIEQFGSVAE